MILKHLVKSTFNTMKKPESGVKLTENGSEEQNRVLRQQAPKITSQLKKDMDGQSLEHAIDAADSSDLNAMSQDDSEKLITSVQDQQKSIDSIMQALKGLSSFKQDIQNEISSVAHDLGQIKGS